MFGLWVGKLFGYGERVNGMWLLLYGVVIIIRLVGVFCGVWFVVGRKRFIFF